MEYATAHRMVILGLLLGALLVLAGVGTVSARADGVERANSEIVMSTSAPGTVTVPGTVEAEDYAPGGEGVAYHDTTPGNSGGVYRQDDVDIAALASGGYAITGVQDGEWLTYTVNASETGLYIVTMRVASTDNDPWIRLRANNETYSVNYDVPYTGSLVNWYISDPPEICWDPPGGTGSCDPMLFRLNQGTNTLKVEFHGDNQSLDWLAVQWVQGLPTWTPTPTPTETPSMVYKVPGGVGLPTDTNGDGLYDDVNGNAARDFNDIVLYFHQMDWIMVEEPLRGFDYNGNGAIDFADIIWLFSHL